MQQARTHVGWLAWRNACGRWAGATAAALAYALLVAPALAADAPPAREPPMIPPGQEELLATMLGKGVTLAGCTFTGGEVIYTTVRATYACPGGAAVFELSHPSTAPREAIQTGQFAIILQSGSPPRSLADALVAHIRSQEDAFEWEDLVGEDAGADDAGDDDE